MAVTVETEEFLEGHKFLMESWVQSMGEGRPNASPVFHRLKAFHLLHRKYSLNHIEE